MSEPAKVYVGNLSFNTEEEDLRTAFTKSFGDVSDVVVIRDRDTGRSRGFGFVTFNEAHIAQNAIDYDSFNLDDRNLKIQSATDRSSGGGGGGGRGGGGGYSGGGGRRGGGGGGYSSGGGGGYSGGGGGYSSGGGGYSSGGGGRSGGGGGYGGGGGSRGYGDQQW